MRHFPPRLVGLLITAASAAVFAAIGHFGANALIAAQQTRQLAELADVALRRAESAVDYGAVTLDEFIKQGPVSCDPSALQAIRLHVYLRGAVKDIRLLSRDGLVLCSAYSETLEFDRGWARRNEMLPARDAAVRIFRVDQFFGVALGVLKDIDEKASIAAVLSISPSLFDIMPSELRDHAAVAVELGDGQPLMQAAPDAPATENPQTITATSRHYPLGAVIRIDKQALLGWNREPYAPIMALSVLLGLAFGALLGRVVAPSASPTAEIDRALAAHEFRPYLQPIFSLRSGAIIGCEALARWVRPDGAVIPPSRFIHLVEASGRIEALTWQILSAALGELKLELARERHFKISVNFVPHHVIAPGFVAELQRHVASAGALPHQVVIELTEREEFDDLSAAAAVVAELRDLGFRVAIDDVGVGHSGLSHIQKLGANILKIDKFFVDSICRDFAATVVVDMLVRLARELNMTLVAEGIEEQEQVAALLACGIEEGQGYVVSPPIPVSDFKNLLVRVARSTIDDQIDRPVAGVA
jgi:sensor c-di-GMP phosphodiesterase-like protein